MTTTYTVLGIETRPKFDDYSDALDCVNESEAAGKFVSVLQNKNGSLWTVYKSERSKDGAIILNRGWAK